MSGSALAPWSLVGEPAKFAAYVSHHVNCSPDLPHQMLLKCLRDKPLSDIMSTPVRAPDFGNAFGPSVDGVVIGTFYVVWIIPSLAISILSSSSSFASLDLPVEDE